MKLPRWKTAREKRGELNLTGLAAEMNLQRKWR